jgi:hypothetical protein
MASKLGRRRVVILFLAAVCALFGMGLIASPAQADTTPTISGTSWMGGDGVNACSMTGTWDSISCGGQTPVGSAWQCVELAQRVYKHNGWYPGNFPSVSYAYQIYSQAAAGNLSSMSVQANGSVTSIAPGDMIVHNYNSDNSPDSNNAGHVAVVDYVDGAGVHVVEQNYAMTAHQAVYGYNASTGTLSRTLNNGYGKPIAIMGVVHSSLNTLGSGSGSAGNSGPDAVSWGVGRIDIFGRGSTGDLTHTFYDSSTGWSTWESLGGGITGTPSAVSWYSGRIDVFVTGTDGHLYQKTYTTASGWSAYTNLGGSLGSAPSAVAWSNGRIDIFARGTSGDLVHTFYDTGGWSTWESLGGGITGAPSATSWASGELNVYAEGTDSHLYYRTYNTATGWSAWALPIGGTLGSGPGAVSWGSGRSDIFIRGTGGDLDHTFYDSSAGGWSTSWESLGGGIAGPPTAVSWQSGRIDVFARGTDNHLYQRSYTSGTWSSWTYLGGNLY